MVCSTAILSASLALSLLNNATLPSESFVISPISLNTALAILHDGAGGITQQQLTNFLLAGCTPSDVTEYYSVRSQLPTMRTAVAFKSANRFYLDTNLTLKKKYHLHVRDKYHAMVLSINLKNKTNAARAMNDFVEKSTNGKIRDLVKAEDMNEDGVAYLINAVYFNGQWKEAFEHDEYRTTFHGHAGTRKEAFMTKTGYFRAQIDCDSDYDNARCEQSTAVVLLPYQDESYNLFIVLPGVSSTLETLRSELNGKNLLALLKEAKESKIHISLPKFKIESSLDALEVINTMGVNDLTDLTKISDGNLEVTAIKQKAMIEVNEKGTEAAAATYIEIVIESAIQPIIPSVVVDRPFLFGILHNDDILFLGQYV